MLLSDFSTTPILAAALIGAAWAASFYLAARICMIPGRPRTFSLLYKGRPVFRSSLLSPLSTLYGRLQWYRLARSKGLSSTALADQILQEGDSVVRPAIGTPVCSFDRVLVWDDDCLDDDTLDGWSKKGDELADRAINALAKSQHKSLTSSDTLDRMLEIRSRGTEEGDQDILEFLASAERCPLAGCGAVSQTWYDDKARRNEKVLEVDERAQEREILKRARLFFLSNGSILFASLLHAGLIGGFASPRIVKVLNGTGYLLSPTKTQRDKQITYTERLSKEDAQRLLDEVTVSTQKCKDRVFRRLLETLHFILDVVEDDSSMSPPSSWNNDLDNDDESSPLIKGAGVGWLAATRVRLLHAGVRKRLCPDGINGTEDIVPISQDEMVGSLCLFSVATLSSLDRMGLSASEQERSDYVSLWRHVGYYMGIEPSILSRTFRDVHSAERAYACVAGYHFRGVNPSPGPETTFSKADYEAEAVVALRGPALPLLHSVAGRPGAGLHFSVHIALTRFLLGDSLADALYLPKTTITQSLAVHTLIITLAIPFLFVKYYPRKAWKDRLARVQQRAFREVLEAALLKSDASTKEADRKQGFLSGKVRERSVPEGNPLWDNVLLVGEVVAVCLCAISTVASLIYFFNNNGR